MGELSATFSNQIQLPDMENSSVSTALKPRQFSLRFLLVAFPLAGLALAYPGCGFLALVMLPLSLIVGAMYVVAAFVYWILANDRRHVASFAIRNICCLVILNLLLIAYAFYATWFYGAMSLD
ncbi:hypothetical protein N9231_05225 [Saprospiraceae bacterium]|nr:hypothetical protein [Saprospiraceae bacterium]